MNFLRIISCFIFWGLVLASCTDSEISIGENDEGIFLSNNKVKVVSKRDESGFLVQDFYAKNNKGEFEKVISSFKPQFPHNIKNGEIARLYDTNLSPKRYLLSEVKVNITPDKRSKAILIKGKKENIVFQQKISLEPQEKKFHISVKAIFPDQVNEIDYLLNTYSFNVTHPPYFVHTPGLKFDNEESRQNRFRIVDSQDQIIGDRAYHSPAIILQEKNLFCGLVPDLNIINEKRVVSPDARRTSWIPRNIFGVEEIEKLYTLPTALDLNVKSGITDKPIFSFGFMDAIIGHHIRYNRMNDTTMVREFSGDTLHYAFDLFLDARAEDYRKYGDIAQYIWEKYGSGEFGKGKHLALPFDEYHRIIDSITFSPSQHKDIDIPVEGYANTGSWLQWENKNGIKMGGYRPAINWWNDKLHNSQFWNNARDAEGFWFWGEKLNYAKDKERAKRIINWCLSAPQNNNGLFATLFNANEKTWALQFSDPMHNKKRFFLEQSDSYDVAAMSKTGAHLLSFYLNCKKDERIINYLKPYGNWLLSVTDERGSVPAYVSREMKQSDILRYSAHPAASAWFLAELFNATHEEKYLMGAKKIADYLIREIIPEAKWIDFEQFFSCGHRPLFFKRDIIQNQIARGSLSVIWGSEAFAALHRATGAEIYLENGEACVDYLSFFQCSWNPHYIYTAYPFGGVSSDNADNANFLDARQAECVKPFIYFGKQSGRQDLLERAVAAARASIVLINHPRHISNGIYEHPNIYPFGLGPENIDHEGYPQSAMRTHPGWGEGSGVYTGLGQALKGLGDLYVNANKKIAVGVNGVLIKEVQFDDEKVVLQVDNELSDKYLNEAWPEKFPVTLKIDGDVESVFINGEEITVSGNQIPLVVLPENRISLYKSISEK
jgi:hypothetical protein